jgi:hypothetical protein
MPGLFFVRTRQGALTRGRDDAAGEVSRGHSSWGDPAKG